MPRTNDSIWERLALAWEIKRAEGCSMSDAWMKAAALIDEYRDYARRWDQQADEQKRRSRVRR